MTVAEVSALALALTFAYPWALVVLPAPRPPVTLALTTMALSIGALTLGMMWLALLAPGLLNLGVIIGLMVLVFAGGMWWLLKAEVVRGGAPSARALMAAARRSPLTAGAVIITLAVGALIVFNAGYWPFGDWDTFAIYGRLAKSIYLGRTLPTGEGLYEAYPLLVPLSFTFTHLVAGGFNEYLARLGPAALAVGALAAAYALGRAMYGLRAGVAAALTLALTPTYTRWASAGYADLPAAFFFTLCALFVWRLSQTGSARDAALAGVMAGLAVWTKNSALVLVASLLLWIGYTHVRARLWAGDGAAKPVTARQAALTLAMMALVAGPWYVRNLLLFGVIVPPTGWTWAAQPTLANLFPFVSYPDAYFVAGFVFTVGIGLCAWRAARGAGDAALLLIFCAPLFAAWWALFSYETRFLLLILPLAAVMGGHALDTALVRVTERVAGRRWLAWGALALLVALALPAANKAVLHKREILRNPLMGDAAKHQLQSGPAHAVGAYLSDALPDGARVLSTVLFVDYYTRAGIQVDINPAVHEGYDYWVIAPDTAVDAPPGELLAEIDGARIYAAAADP